MNGVTTAIVGFIFVCIIFPSLIKNRHQYYMALAAVLIGLVLQSIAMAINAGGLIRVVAAIGILLDAIAVLLLVMAAGGLSPRQLAGDMARAYQVMRRGEDEVTTIIPREDQPRRRAAADDDDDEDDGPTRYVIDDPAKTRSPRPDAGSIPLE